MAKISYREQNQIFLLDNIQNNFWLVKKNIYLKSYTRI